jgi:hypothetical protein
MNESLAEGMTIYLGGHVLPMEKDSRGSREFFD